MGDVILEELGTATEGHAVVATEADAVDGMPTHWVAQPDSTEQTAAVMRVAANHDLAVVVGCNPHHGSGLLGAVRLRHPAGRHTVDGICLCGDDGVTFRCSTELFQDDVAHQKTSARPASASGWAPLCRPGTSPHKRGVGKILPGLEIDDGSKAHRTSCIVSRSSSLNIRG